MFAFEEFRKERVLSNNPYILVTKLDRYSEKGALYGIELEKMISFNKFMQYDERVFEKPKKSEVIVIKKNEVILESEKKEVVIHEKEKSILNNRELPTKDITLNENMDIKEEAS